MAYKTVIGNMFVASNRKGNFDRKPLVIAYG